NLFLLGKRDFLLILMGNPNLMEHELFTELLRAVFHLAEELKLRNTISDLPATDRRHIAGDINRVYGLLVREWISYVKHLKNNFPYMFSLAMRTNPFDQTASVIVK
ncbi:MAG: two pore domain potassium channel family protein, partial [Deltaproteobacteria bacterium]|nr:two pore domain potassium channel family protein [Deltaproteobacteria bacterium]